MFSPPWDKWKRITTTAWEMTISKINIFYKTIKHCGVQLWNYRVKTMDCLELHHIFAYSRPCGHIGGKSLQRSLASVLTGSCFVWKWCRRWCMRLEKMCTQSCTSLSSKPDINQSWHISTSTGTASGLSGWKGDTRTEKLLHKDKQGGKYQPETEEHHHWVFQHRDILQRSEGKWHKMLCGQA